MYALVYHKNLLSIYNTNISLIGTSFSHNITVKMACVQMIPKNYWKYKWL